MKYGYKAKAVWLLVGAAFSAVAGQKEYALRYTRPAAEWKHSMPLGNSHLGATVPGGVETDTFVINEETIWSGKPGDHINPKARESIDELRRLVAEEKIPEAIELAERNVIGARKIASYTSLEDLIFTYEHNGIAENYLRTLNLNTAVARVSYEVNGARYVREYFISYPDDAMIMRLTTTAREGLHFTVQNKSQHGSRSFAEENMLMNKGGVKGKGAIQFCSGLKILKGQDNATVTDQEITVNGAKEVIISYVAKTSYVNHKDVSADAHARYVKTQKKLDGKSYDQLLKAHAEDFSSLFNRMSFELSAEPNTKDMEATTDELLARTRAGEDIPYMGELFFQMGRYLTISGSRPGSLPLNLLGKWLNRHGGWGGKWTLNINAQMNYWPTEAANLSECHIPLIEMVQRLGEMGKVVAKESYGCRGFVAHINTDLWNCAGPVGSGRFGLWQFGGAWLTRHIWEHYQYTQDKEFLKENYYLLKDASLFFFDFLTPGSDGYLVANPTTSFEETYSYAKGKYATLSESATMSDQILHDLFSNTMAAAKVIGDDPKFIEQLKHYKNQLKPTPINPQTGDVGAWYKPHHNEGNPAGFQRGQIGPIWGLNPGVEINPIDTPELAKAAAQTMDYRDVHLEEENLRSTGSWIWGTRSSFRARLHDAEKFYYIYRRTLEGNLYDNLWCVIYPHDYFQIDCNFGVTSAMMEAIMQSHRKADDGKVIVDVLPALPKAWANGQIRGMKVRGGLEADIAWRDGKLASLEFRSAKGSEFYIQTGEKMRPVKIPAGKAAVLGDLSLLTSDTWGAENVLPRDLSNGIEDPDWSCWGGKIIKGEDGKYHMFPCRWSEDNKRGHCAWMYSQIVHAVSENPLGPYEVVEKLGPGVYSRKLCG